MARPNQAPRVGVVMGSDSDWDIMRHAVAQLDAFGVAHEARVLSAHRMPDDMFEYAEDAGRARACAHHRRRRRRCAPCRECSRRRRAVPVLGVPVPSKYLRGEDSLLSIVQMPKGIPVATFAIGEAGAANAGAVRRRDAGAGPIRRSPTKLDRVPREADRRGQRDDACRPQQRRDRARRLARPAGRRPARPHVLHGRAKPGLQGRRARSGRDRSRRQRRRSPHPRRLSRSRGSGRRSPRWPAPRPPNSRTCRRPRSTTSRRASASRRRRRASPSRRTASARRRSCRRTASRVAPFAVLDKRGRCAARRSRALAPASSRARASATTARVRFGCDSRPTMSPRRGIAHGQVALRPRAVRRAGAGGFGDRRAQRQRRGRDLAGRREPASRRHSRRRSIVPARISDALAAERASDSRSRVADKLDYRGVLCVEMFVLDRRRAPRQRDRAAAAQQRPLHDRRLRDVAVRAAGARARRPAARRHAQHARGHGQPAGRHLVRCVAPDIAREPDWCDVLQHPSAKLHLYGKAEARRGRKMGHVTCLAPALADAVDVARSIKEALRMPLQGEL